MDLKIRIKRGNLLEPFFKAYVEQNYPDYVFPTEEMIKEKTILFNLEWKKYHQKFLDGLREVGLEFKRNYIDVLIISATNRCMSSPLIIRSRYSPEEFVSVLVHELLHVLFVDNKFIQEYEKENQVTKNHIYVFAVATYLFKDVFGEAKRLELEKSKSSPNKNQDYRKAWQTVERVGYKKIIEGIKKPPRNERFA